MAKVAEYVACRDALKTLVDENNCAPILIRLAWHDSGNYDKRIVGWPACGGANASILFEPEITYGANAGLAKAVGLLKPLKEKYKQVGWADLMQMASAVAVEVTGGPVIPLRYGRADASDGSACPERKSRGTADNAGLPDAKPPFGCGASDPATHLRAIFNRMGFDDEGIVALSGAHTVGRAFKDRSGTVEAGTDSESANKFTGPKCLARCDGKPGIGMPGGQPWTSNWLTFDNSYFKAHKTGRDKDLNWFPTDAAIADDEKFKVYFDRFAESQEAFFEAYQRAHVKLSELGSKFEAGGFFLPADGEPAAKRAKQ